jgi:uncharacterized protein YjbI with pentapeptide repeats
MKSPHHLADLPWASELQSFDGLLAVDGDYDRIRFDGSTFEDATAGGSRITESAFTGVTLDGGRMRRARLSGVWFGETRMVAFDMAESSLTDVWFSGCVFAGTQAFALTTRRVAFRDCKLDSVNFRDAALTDVVFEDCLLRDVDFGGAKLTRLRFPGSTLSGTDFTKVSCTDVDLRRAKLGAGAPGDGGIRAGYESLRGVRIDTLQLMTLAPLLAHQLGITIEDDGVGQLARKIVRVAEAVAGLVDRFCQVGHSPACRTRAWSGPARPRLPARSPCTPVPARQIAHAGQFTGHDLLSGDHSLS